ncbi:hypothetical protein ARMGADRAFT_789499 [Armillaria gallica]|uniref:Uncharacterized protein n=1 Tax=Armillaria gallica TaxID=47427 RepID=A0A2H3DMV1_ARMGA|nr:hypothetical protein ARMGADRAFT_789499 [Armillaria gallica]
MCFHQVNKQKTCQVDDHHFLFSVSACGSCGFTLSMEWKGILTSFGGRWCPGGSINSHLIVAVFLVIGQLKAWVIRCFLVQREDDIYVKPRQDISFALKEKRRNCVVVIQQCDKYRKRILQYSTVRGGSVYSQGQEVAL